MLGIPCSWSQHSLGISDYCPPTSLPRDGRRTNEATAGTLLDHLDRRVLEAVERALHVDVE